MLWTRVDCHSSAVSLAIGPASGTLAIPDPYSGTLAVRFSMSLNGVTTKEDGSLFVPVQVTLPVPTGLDPDLLAILHYPQTGAPEIVPYTIYTNEGQTYVRFVLDYFSDFVLTQPSARTTQAANLADRAASPITSLYTDYSVSTDAPDSNGVQKVTISATDLKKHVAGNDILAYWAGFAVAAPEGATQMKTASGMDLTTVNADLAAATAEAVYAGVAGTGYDQPGYVNYLNVKNDTNDGRCFAVAAPEGATSMKYAFSTSREALSTLADSSLEQNVVGDQPGVAFYTNASAGTDTKTWAQVQWLDEDDNVLSSTVYHIDLSAVTLALPADAPEIVTAKLHDTSDALQDDQLYTKDSYTADLISQNTDGSYNVALAAKQLREHVNGQGTRGHWIGFELAAPTGATQFTVNDGDAEALEALPNDRQGVAFYFNASDLSARTLTLT